MSLHTFDETARQDVRRLMNSPLLRVLSVAALSVVFALINCVGQAGSESQFSALASGAAPAGMQATAAAPADPFDSRAGTDAPVRRN